MTENDDFDTLLDRAIADSAEPVPGMEERVLAEVGAQVRRDARRSRRAWWAAGSVAAVLALCAALLPLALHQQETRTARSQEAAVSAAPQLAAAMPNVPRQPRMEPASSHAAKRRHALRMAAVDRSARDPGNRVPLPLIVPEDAQERALRIAITRPGFLAALDAAEAPPKPWKPDDLSDGNSDESQMKQERK